MRIIHFEDEWAKTRSIAHWLHDRIFEELSREDAVNLELVEKEDPANDSPSRISAILMTKPRRLIFEYVLVTNVKMLKTMATKEDIVIVDIMRNDKNGRFVSILGSILEIFRAGGFAKDNWRYFSAYPEKVPDECELEGYTKRQEGELIEFLLAKSRERRLWS